MAVACTSGKPFLEQPQFLEIAGRPVPKVTEKKKRKKKKRAWP